MKHLQQHMIGLVAVSCVLYSVPNAQAQTTDFESFSTGVTVSYQGSGGTAPSGPYTIPDPYGSLWTVVDEWGLGRLTDGDVNNDYDERVVDDGTGNIVWRFSNAVTSGGFSDQPSSPSSPAVAGETGASLFNDRGTNHTTPISPPLPRASATTPYFHAGFRFKSATGAAQPGLALSMSPYPRQSNFRMSYLAISDTGSGLDLLFYETNATGGFVGPTVVATGLSYTDWHQVDLYVEFVDGLNVDGAGNDIVTIMLDGVSLHTGTTWETFQRLTFGDTPVLAIDALMFRSSGTAAPGTAGAGLFFDDVTIDNEMVPEPPPGYSSLGQCISSLIEENCGGLKGRDRATCNHEQQMTCFDIFDVE